MRSSENNFVVSVFTSCNGPAEDVKLSAALEATNGSFVCMYFFPFVKKKKQKQKQKKQKKKINFFLYIYFYFY